MEWARVGVRALLTGPVAVGTVIVLILTGCGEPDAIPSERVSTSVSSASSSVSGDVSQEGAPTGVGSTDTVGSTVGPTTGDLPAPAPTVVASNGPVTTPPATDVPGAAAAAPSAPPPVGSSTVNTLQVFAALRTAQLPAATTTAPVDGSADVGGFVTTVFDSARSVWDGYFDAIQAGAPAALSHRTVDVAPASCAGTAAPAIPAEGAAPLYCGAVDGIFYPAAAVTLIRNSTGASNAVRSLAAGVFVSRPYGQYVIDVVKNQLGLPDFDAAAADRSLLADCLVGTWAYATYVGLSAPDISAAMALQPVDADPSSGQLAGSAPQRTEAFQRGYAQGSPGTCVFSYWTGLS